MGNHTSGVVELELRGDESRTMGVGGDSEILSVDVFTAGVTVWYKDGDQDFYPMSSVQCVLVRA